MAPTEQFLKVNVIISLASIFHSFQAEVQTTEHRTCGFSCPGPCFLLQRLCEHSLHPSTPAPPYTPLMLPSTSLNLEFPNTELPLPTSAWACNLPNQALPDFLASVPHMLAHWPPSVSLSHHPPSLFGIGSVLTCHLLSQAFSRHPLSPPPLLLFLVGMTTCK